MVENAFIASVCANAHTDHEAGGTGDTWDRVLLSGDTENSFMYMWKGPDSAPIHRRSCGSVSVSFPDGQENVSLGDNIFGLASRESALPAGKLLTTGRPIIEKVLNQVDDVAATYEGGPADTTTIQTLAKIADDGTIELTDAVSDLYTNEGNMDLKKLMDAMDD